MFGTSGIRGLYGSVITELLAIKVANAFSGARGSFSRVGSSFSGNEKAVEKTVSNAKGLAIARDIRKTGVSLSMAVASGALAAGVDVIELGIVPTPTVALATRKHSCNGIMITASHNPPEYNGFKLISETKEIDKSYEQLVEKRMGEPLKLVAWDSVGKSFRDEEIIRDHIDMIKGILNLGGLDTETLVKIAKKKPYVIVDCNGAGSVITPQMLREIGCRVKTINDSLEEFSRPSEPSEQNLTKLIKLIKSEQADFGLAHDGDADRVIVIDNEGNILPLDVQLAMMIDHEMELSKQRNTGNSKKIITAKIITTMEASLTLREVVEKNGGELIITPVGSTYVAEALERENALFGGEPCGEYIYCDGVHVPDAILAAAKFVDMFCKKGKFSEQMKRYKQYFISREKFQVPKTQNKDEKHQYNENKDRYKDKYSIVEEIKSLLKDESQLCSLLGISPEEKNNLKRTDEDGIRIDESDGWFLIRASGTEPIIRLTLEYKAKEKLKSRAEILKKIITEKLTAKHA